MRRFLQIAVIPLWIGGSYVFYIEPSWTTGLILLTAIMLSVQVFLPDPHDG